MTQGEKRIVRLRNLVASLYDADLGQELVIRMILNPELDDLAVLTKAKWLFRNRLRDESHYVWMDDDEELGLLHNHDDTNRIHAGIELHRLISKYERVGKLVKIALGCYTLSGARKSIMRARNRQQEPESL